MKISIIKGSAKSNKLSTLVVFVPSQKKSKVSLPGAEAEVVSQLKAAVEEDVFTGKKDETLSIRNFGSEDAQHLLLVGLGDVKSTDTEMVRRAGAVATNALSSLNLSGGAIDCESLLKSIKDKQLGVQVFVEGAMLSQFSWKQTKKDPKDPAKKPESLGLLPPSKANTASLKKGLEEGVILAECVCVTRELGDKPGNYMTPTILANEAVKGAKGVANLKVTVFDKARIKKEKMGGLLGVSKGTSEDPRFIIMEYKGAAASKKPIAFVGKGLTFDAGGISIKPAAGMDEMKYDMQGGASVVGTLLAIARLKLKVNAIGYIPASENLCGASATKPGDILTARNGKTIEVLNTDAEGRLILADALVYATEKKPKCVLDAATLTGAMVVALGNTHTGVFSRDSKLVKQIESAGKAADEAMWPMPLTDDHKSDMKGVFADLQNISSFRGAGSSTAAAFLENFIENDIPWAHFDIAGTAWNQGNRSPYCAKKGATGTLVRTWVEFAKNNG